MLWGNLWIFGQGLRGNKMTLVVPEANTPFSLVEQPRLNPNQPNVGDAIAKIGDLGVDYAAKKKKAETAQQVSEARITAIERLDEIRSRYEVDGDVNGLTDRWQAEAAGVIDEATQGLPKYLQDEFRTDMRGVLVPQTSAIRRRETGLFMDGQRATLNAAVGRFERAAAAAPDEESRNAILSEAAASIGSALDNGTLKPTEAQKMLEDLPGSVLKATALRAVAEDPEGYLERSKAGEFDALDPQDRARLDISAKAGADQNSARLQRAERLEAEAYDKALGAEVDDAVKILEGGLTVDGLPELLERADNTPHGQRLRATVNAVTTAENFALLSPVEQQAVLEDARSAGTRDPEDVARINRLEKLRQNTIKSIEDDQLSHVRERGMAEVPPVDIFDPASVRNRVALAGSVTNEFTAHNPSLRLFDNQERDALRDQLSKTDTDSQLKILTAITNNFGDYAPIAMGELGVDDPAVATAGMLVINTRDPAAARTILQGRKMLSESQGAKVTASTRRAAEAQVLGAFPESDRAQMAMIMQAADAHFAAAGMGQEKDGQAVVDAYVKSIQAVTGQRRINNRTYGGIQEINDRQTMLPANLTSDDVENAIERFPADAWKAASSSGREPMWGDYPVTEWGRRWRRDLMLVSDSKNPGYYYVVAQRRDGSEYALPDEHTADGYFRLNLERFVTGAGNDR